MTTMTATAAPARSPLDTAAISSRAMLVCLTISQWGGRALDRVVTEDVARTHDVSSDAGQYRKVLVAKKYLEPITKAVSAMRAFHYDNTLPWTDDGARILPSANYFPYRQRMAELKDEFDRACEAFTAQYAEVKRDAEQRLKGMYREADYPPDVAKLFGIRVRFLPFPDAKDFRVDLSNDVADTLRAGIQRDVNEAAQAAVASVWKRIAEVVGKMSERLKAYRINPDSGKVEGAFRDSLVENVRELVDLLPRLNFTGDAELERVAGALREQLLSCDANTLRTHESKRVATIEAADAILAQMAGYIQ